MELAPLYRCVAALDVHQAKLMVCILREQADGELRVELREFGGFKRDRRDMAHWVASFAPESMVMESTGIYCGDKGSASIPIRSGVCFVMVFEPLRRERSTIGGVTPSVG